MDAITLSTSFATIIGLLFNFVSDERSQSEDKYQEFLSWLSNKRHEELRDYICSNLALSEGIKHLLHETTDKLLQRMSEIDKLLASVAAHFEGVDRIAATVRPDSKLSEQAISVLRQIDTAEASLVLQQYFRGTPYLVVMDGHRGNIAPEEPRFFKDDIATLCEFGFLRHDVNKKGEDIYYFTRLAESFVRTVKTTDDKD